MSDNLQAQPMHSVEKCVELAQAVDHFVLCASAVSQTALEVSPGQHWPSSCLLYCLANLLND